MSRLLRLVYVSKATFASCPESSVVSTQMRDILTQARKNNRKAKIGGALFFVGGYFFQCLEGKEQSVYQLLEKIKHDPRHENFKISYCKTVPRRHFRDWSMKYVPIVNEIKEIMTAGGYSSFTPTEFDESDINFIVDAFSNIDDASLNCETLRIDCRPKFHGFKFHWYKKTRLASHANSSDI